MKGNHESSFNKILFRFLLNNHLSQEKGFNLLELLIVTVILGILSAIAVPNLLKQVDKARYTQAIADMRCVSNELRAFHLENGYFPKDVSRNTKPTGINCFPVSSQNKILFDSVYDYESWGTSGNKCYIQITFLGKDKTRNSPTNQAVFPQPGLYYDYDDDLIMSLGIFDVPCQ